ncbi:molybdopterin synthase sulfur carrier subunit [Archaeoglobales archaeon]|nr:MAG: molybdopterin synthase sulfur carrier subunit [Archaeoglobales archaeon ex4484_92]RLI83136.1 MAG: molybdopterin synthase sulfur carrier subunit [Archaeoglobales archaeon]
MVKVKLFANFREIAGVREVEIDARDVYELLNKLVVEFPKMRELVFEGDRVREYVNIMVNEDLVRGNKDLSPSDVVAIFPPVSGGK